MDHNRILAAAAKDALAPIACIRKGRSRTWLDDHVWWVGVIEFQPSAWSRGSYLNVGVCWLWYEKDFLSFDYGARNGNPRIELFQEFRSAAQFDEKARHLAERAKTESLALRKRFARVADAAAVLRQLPATTIWDHYHAGMSAALAGQVDAAKESFARVASDNRPLDWVMELKQWTRFLMPKAENTPLFRHEIAAVVARMRKRLKLPDAEADVRFDR